MTTDNDPNSVDPAGFGTPSNVTLSYCQAKIYAGDANVWAGWLTEVYYDDLGIPDQSTPCAAAFVVASWANRLTTLIGLIP